jgi:hypothetical protein
MKIPVFKIRYWSAIVLCVLGLAVMPAINVYYNRSSAGIGSYLFFLQIYLWCQWLPFTIVLLVGAAYAFPDARWRLPAWIVFSVGSLLSVFSIVYRLALH